MGLATIIYVCSFFINQLEFFIPFLTANLPIAFLGNFIPFVTTYIITKRLEIFVKLKSVARFYSGGCICENSVLGNKGYFRIDSHEEKPVCRQLARLLSAICEAGVS